MIDILGAKSMMTRYSWSFLASDKVLRIRASKWFITLTVTIAVFTDMFLYSIVIPVLPFVLNEQLNVEEKDIPTQTSVTLAVFSAGLITGSLLTGAWGDKVKSRKNVMLVGLSATLGATLLSCLCVQAQSLAMLKVGRAFQGLSSAFVWVIGMSILNDTADENDINYLMSFQTVAVSLSMLLGPLIGGIVYATSGYYAVYAVCFAVIGLDIVLRLFMVERCDKRVQALLYAERDQPQENLQLTEMADCCEDNSEALICSDEFNEPQEAVPQLGERYPEVMIKIPFLTKRILIPGMIRMLGNPKVCVNLLQSVAVSAGISVLDSMLSIHLKAIFHWNTLSIALMFLALAAPSLLEPLLGKLADKTGTKTIMTGAFLWCVPFYCLLIIPKNNTIGDKVLFAAMLALLAFGLASLMGPVMAELTVVIAEDETKRPGIYGKGGGSAQAFALFNIAYSIGTLITPLSMARLYDSLGWSAVMICFAIFYAIMAAPTVLVSGGYLLRRNQNSRDEVQNGVITEQPVLVT